MAKKTAKSVLVRAVRKKAKDYSVNALSKLLGHDRRTIDKAIVDLTPTRTVGKTKYYRREEVEIAIKARDNRDLKDQIDEEKLRSLRNENDREERLVVKRALVGESIRRCLGPAAATLEQRLMNEYPTAVSGLDAPQVRAYGKKLVDEILGFFRALQKEWLI